MAVRFVIGRSGSGKTSRCFRAIVEALKRDPLGPPIYWIVPKQATFMAERELTCGSGLDGFCRVRVASFEQLGEDILADCGGIAVPQVTAAGKQMVLGHLLRTLSPKLQFFKSAARRAGLAAELDATFAEFERCGKNVGDLEALVDGLQTSAETDPQAKSLLAKFHDLHLLYNAYCNYLGKETLDQHRRFEQVLQSIERCRLFKDAAVHVDGFLEFTNFERKTLAGIAKVCAEMEIALLLDPASPVINEPHILPEDLSLFHRTEETYRRLWHTFHEQEIPLERPVLLSETPRFSNANLAHAEQHLFGQMLPARKSSGIELIVAPDRRAEVDAAARKIRQWLREGLRLRDIVVLTRDLEACSELIDASFNEHSIPYFADRRRTAAHHPLPQVVRSVFLLALHDWPHDAMMTLLKSGLCGLSLDEADEVENYVIAHRIRGNIWAAEEPWPFVRNLTRDSEADLPPGDQFQLERIDSLRRKVIEPLRAFVANITTQPALPVKHFITELFALLEKFGVRKTLLGWMKATDDLEQRGEHEQVWAELVKLLDQMSDVMGNESVPVADFLAILESGLEQFDLAIAPPTVDQVLVGGVERTRTSRIKATIVLGLCEGEFPRAPRDQTILSDGERRALKRRKLEIDPDSERKLLDENLLGYIAFTRGSDRLCVTRSSADDAGWPQLPSLFWRRLTANFPDAPIEEIRRDDGHNDGTAKSIGTPRQLVTGLMRWVRHSPDHAEPAWRNLYSWLANYKFDHDAIDNMRFRAWRALSYENRATLSPDIAARLFRSPLDASVSRIETFATCPFKHFARYGLGLSQRDDAEVSSLDLGNVYHGILENLVREMVAANKTWNTNPKNVTDAAIRKFAQQIGEELRGELMLSSARNQYLLQHIERTLGRVVESQSAAGRRGRFRPIRAELEFGTSKSDSLPPLELRTPNKNILRLRGKIDRIDLLEDETAFAVIDYKLSGSKLSLDRVYHGISLQLLAYLLVLAANGEKLVGRKITPVAAFYVKLLQQLENVDHPNDAPPADEEESLLKLKPRGLIHREYLNAVDSQLSPGQISQVVQARINKDGALGNRASSDVAEAVEFSSLLKHVERRLCELGDEILAGQIDVQPYRMNNLTPCPQCEYRSVCRFDLLTNRYHQLTVLGREAVLEKLALEVAP